MTRKILTFAFWVLIIYTITGILLLPLVTKLILEKKVSKIIQHTIHVKHVRFNPFTLQAELEGFKIEDNDATDLIRWKEFSINFQIASLWKDSWIFKNVSLTDPYIKVVIAPDASLNLMSLVPPPDPQAAPKPETSNKPDKPKNLVIQNLAINGGVFEFTDQSGKNVFHHVVEPINLSADNVSTQPDETGAARISFNVSEQGKITITNNMSLNPLRGSADISLESIPLNIVQPYIANMSKAELASGLLNLSSHISYEPDNASQIFRFEGDTSISSLILNDTEKKQPLVSFDNLSLKQLTFTLPDNALTIGDVTLSKPVINIGLEPDHRLNAARIFQPAETGTTSTTTSTQTQAPAPAAVKPLLLSIKNVSINNGALTFTDASIEPSAVIALSEMTTSLQNISLRPDAKIQMTISTRINEQGKISVDGSIQPFLTPIGMNLSVNVENFIMKALDPYIQKYVGYETNNGTLNIAIKYSIEDGKLQGDHNVLLDTFVLGRKSESPDAPSLPVKLALYLIEDLNQQIKLNLPVSGDLNEPTFKYSGMIIQVVMNVLTKALASPFNMLGGLFGGGPVDLSFAGFSPSQAILSTDEHSKIMTLAKALNSKPRLILIINGTADSAYDVLTDKNVRDLERMQAENPSQNNSSVLIDAYDKLTTAAGNFWPIRKLKSLKPEKTIEPAQIPPEKINWRGLKLLAQQRAETVRSILINEGGIDPERVRLEEIDVEKSHFADGVIKTDMALSVE